MKPRSLFIPRGAWLVAIIVWASALTLVVYLGTLKAAEGLSVEDCRLPNSALAPRQCLVDKQSDWFWSLTATSLPWLLLFGVILPVALQAVIRFLWRRFKRTTSI